MKRYAPATLRNRDPIAQVLREELPENGSVLEIASGSGEHAVFFARLFSGLLWQPSDPDDEAVDSIAAWREEEGGANLLRPLNIDAAAKCWPVGDVEAIFCANMAHISLPEATEGLIAGAGRVLREGGPLILYGPYLEEEVPTAASNLDFDQSLKARDARWGLRKVSWIDSLAKGSCLKRTRRIAMPANNLMLVYRRY